MNASTKHNALRHLVFLLCLSVGSTCYAWHGGGGWHGGGWHGGGWHGGGWHGGGWHGGGWRGAGWGGGWYGGGWGWGAPAVVIGVPAAGYYAAPCRTVRVCNSYGRCWLRRACY